MARGSKQLANFDEIGARLVAGEDPASVPLFGGTLWVDPYDLLTPFTLDGPFGEPGAGSLVLAFAGLDPSLAGRTFTLQGAVLDPGAAGGVALTSAIEVQLR